MEKRCIIEIGSNTIKLFIVKLLDNNEIKTIENQRRITLLGRGINKTGILSTESRQRALNNLEEYLNIINNNNINLNNIMVTATAACRNTSNGQEFIDHIKHTYNIPNITILSGEEEASFGYLGSLLSIPEKKDKIYTVLDIGGSSFQLSYGTYNNCLQKHSYPIGCNNISEEFKLKNIVSHEEVNQTINYISRYNIKDIANTSNKISLIGIGGTIKIIQIMLQSIKNLMPLNYESLLNTAYFIANLNTEERYNWFKEKFPDKTVRKESGLTLHRAEVILGGICIAIGLCNKLNIKEINLSNTDAKDYLIRLNEFPILPNVLELA